MTETIRATEGAKATTAEGSSVGQWIRVVTVVLGVALGVGLWSTLRMGEGARALESRLSGLESGGVDCRVATGETLRQMNEVLFRFQITSSAEYRDEFNAATARFEALLGRAGSAWASQASAEALGAVVAAHQEYQVQVRGLLEGGVRTLRRGTPTEVEELVRERSRPLETAVDRWVELDQEVYQAWMASGAAELRRLRWSLWGSRLGLVAGVVLAAWGYRGWSRAIAGVDGSGAGAVARRERLASLGVLAAGVAHEIRNPLTALKFRLFSLKQALPAGLADHPDLAILEQEIHRLDKIVKDFLEFARPAEPQRRRFAVGDLVREVHGLLSPELAQHRIEVRLDTEVAAEVYADRQQLQQVLINLVRNARESMSEGGRLTLSVRLGTTSWLRRGRSMVFLEVADTGTGIAPEVERRIFDPFFSTKAGGSGLGLPMAARIAELHGGHLQCATRPGRGTTFTLVLPAALSHEGESSIDRG